MPQMMLAIAEKRFDKLKEEWLKWLMAGYGDFYNKNDKKKSKKDMARAAQKQVSSYSVPQPQVIGRQKKFDQGKNL